MGSSHRLAAIAAVSHAGHNYNRTQPDVTHTDNGPYTVNFLFLGVRMAAPACYYMFTNLFGRSLRIIMIELHNRVTLCGVLVAVCAACWRRSPRLDKPEEVVDSRMVYTVSCDAALNQMPEPLPGPPPAYESVVVDSEGSKDNLQQVVTEECPRCHNNPSSVRCDSGLPSYEAAVLLKDTKL